MQITPRKWSKFQHYKKRRPPWIRLYATLVDDYKFQRLQVASRALAPQLWLLASEYSEGIITACPEEIVFRLRQCEKEVFPALVELCTSDFFDADQEFIDFCNSGASTVLATQSRDATPETETEAETETERSRSILGETQPDKQKSKYSPEFLQAWDEYPKRAGNNPKDKAFRAWNARLRDGVTPEILHDAVRRYALFAAETQKIKTEYVMQASTFFGPGRPFDQSWEIPHAESNGGGRPDSRSRAKKVSDELDRIALAADEREVGGGPVQDFPGPLRPPVDDGDRGY